MLTNNTSVESENEYNVEDPTNSLTAVVGKFIFQKGETFGSYDEVLERLEKHQKESFVYYWRRDTRTVERAFTKTSRTLASCLKYYTVHFACVFGGQKFQARGSGKRLRQRLSNRVDCPANIFFRAAKCGKLLEVVSVCNFHNHQISEELNALLPQNRKISETLKEEVGELLNLKIDRKKIIEYVKFKENKNITPKDLFNLSARLKAVKDKKIFCNDKRITVLNRISSNIIDGEIKEICKREISNIGNKFCSIIETEPIIDVEYITPIKNISSNNTILETTITETNQIYNKNSDDTIIFIEPEDFIQIHNENENLSMDNNIDKLNNYIDMDETDSSITRNEMIEDFIVEDEYETNNSIIPNRNTSPIIVFENYLNKQDYNGSISESIETNNTIKYSNENNLIEYEKSEELIETANQHVIENSKNINEEHIEENCTVILYETITDNIDDNKNHDCIVVNNKSDDDNNIVGNQKRIFDIKKSVWKSRRKVNKCYKCGSKTKLLNMQIKYLKAQRDKLVEETKLLKLKRKLLKDRYLCDTEYVS